MTKAQRNAIITPANGLLIFQTDNAPGLYSFNSTGWMPVNDNLGNHIATNNINLNGFRIFNQDSSATLSLSRNGDLSLRTRFKFNNSFIMHPFMKWGAIIIKS